MISYISFLMIKYIVRKDIQFKKNINTSAFGFGVWSIQRCRVAHITFFKQAVLLCHYILPRQLILCLVISTTQKYKLQFLVEGSQSHKTYVIVILTFLQERKPFTAIVAIRSVRHFDFPLKGDRKSLELASMLVPFTLQKHKADPTQSASYCQNYFRYVYPFHSPCFNHLSLKNLLIYADVPLSLYCRFVLM